VAAAEGERHGHVGCEHDEGDHGHHRNLLRISRATKATDSAVSSSMTPSISIGSP
jgi:hypothetical protein